jgi:tetratricopeptide (TPR) repeat protein
MFTNRTRLFIGFFFLLSLLLLAKLRLYEFVAVAFMMLFLLAWDYFRQGTLVVAAKHFHHKDYDKTEQLLHEIFKPEWLSKSRRGYYEYFMGGVCLQRQDYQDAVAHYEIAVQYPLRSVNEHIAALVHVANISIRQGNYEKASAFLDLTDKQKENINAKMRNVIENLRKEIKQH